MDHPAPGHPSQVIGILVWEPPGADLQDVHPGGDRWSTISCQKDAQSGSALTPGGTPVLNLRGLGVNSGHSNASLSNPCSFVHPGGR